MELFEKYRKKYVFKSFDECKFFEAIEDVERLEQQQSTIIND